MALFDLPPKPQHRFWTLLDRMGLVLLLTCVIGFPLLLFWPAEGDRPFDTEAWKQNPNAMEMNIRTSMRIDLVQRIEVERWTRERVRSELGAPYAAPSEERWTYPLGRRRGAWPFRPFGFMTSFDSWSLYIYFDAKGVVVDAHAYGT